MGERRLTLISEDLTRQRAHFFMLSCRWGCTPISIYNQGYDTMGRPLTLAAQGPKR
jgi:hypothetical protein